MDSLLLQQVINDQREIRSLENVMAEINISTSQLITYNNRDTVKTGNNTIRIIQAREWLIK